MVEDVTFEIDIQTEVLLEETKRDSVRRRINQYRLQLLEGLESFKKGRCFLVHTGEESLFKKKWMRRIGKLFLLTKVEYETDLKALLKTNTGVVFNKSYLKRNVLTDEIFTNLKVVFSIPILFDANHVIVEKVSDLKLLKNKTVDITLTKFEPALLNVIKTNNLKVHINVAEQKRKTFTTEEAWDKLFKFQTPDGNILSLNFLLSRNILELNNLERLRELNLKCQLRLETSVHLPVLKILRVSEKLEILSPVIFPSLTEFTGARMSAQSFFNLSAEKLSHLSCVLKASFETRKFFLSLERFPLLKTAKFSSITFTPSSFFDIIFSKIDTFKPQKIKLGALAHLYLTQCQFCEDVRQIVDLSGLETLSIINHVLQEPFAWDPNLSTNTFDLDSLKKLEINSPFCFQAWKVPKLESLECRKFILSGSNWGSCDLTHLTLDDFNFVAQDFAPKSALEMLPNLVCLKILFSNRENLDLPDGMLKGLEKLKTLNLQAPGRFFLNVNEIFFSSLVKLETLVITSSSFWIFPS